MGKNDMTDEERKAKRAAMDTNQDGKISAEERAAWKAANPKGGADDEKDDPLTKEELLAEYGYAADVIYSNEELQKVFEKALKEQWTKDRFLAALKTTEWWKNGKYYRAAYVSQREGAEWKNDIQGATEAVRRRATALGVDLNKRELHKLAIRYLYEGWFDGPRQTLLDNELANYINRKSIGDTDWETQLRTAAYQYGVEGQLDDSWYAIAQRKIARGDETFESLIGSIRERAMSKYLPFADAIKSGQTTRSAMKAYTSSMADLLEVDEDSIDLNDRLLKKAWQTKTTPDGKPAVMTQFEFETMIREDPRWMQTSNGRQATTDLAAEFMRSMGFIGGR